MTITFYTICGMWPGVKAKTLDNRITDDKFCIAFDVTDARLMTKRCGQAERLFQQDRRLRSECENDVMCLPVILLIEEFRRVLQDQLINQRITIEL
jgi:hypothetical protein